MPSYPGVVGGTVPGVAAPGFAYNPPFSLGVGAFAYVFGVLPANPTRLLDDSNVVGETIIAGESSLVISLPSAAAFGSAPSIDVELSFSATPGVFELDIMEANTEADAFYALPSGAGASSKITAVTANSSATKFFAFSSLSPTGGSLIRIFAKTWPNTTVLVTCKITRKS